MVNKAAQYLNFIKSKGWPLAKINPGSNEYALSLEDAFEALKLIEEAQFIIVGGDLLIEDNEGGLLYAYQILGIEYKFLDWHYDTVTGKDKQVIVKDSIIMAKEAIKNAQKKFQELNRKFYIVFVVVNG